jgi:hypothetical protein
MPLQTSSFVMPEQGYYELNYHVALKKNLARTVTWQIGLPLCCGAVAACFLSLPKDIPILVVAPLVVLFVNLIYSFWLCPLFAWDKLNKRKSFAGPWVIKLDEDGVHASSNDQTHDVKWQTLEDVVEARSSVLLFIDKAIAFIIPKTAFGSRTDMDSFIAEAKKQMEAAKK